MVSTFNRYRNKYPFATLSVMYPKERFELKTAKATEVVETNRK